MPEKVRLAARLLCAGTWVLRGVPFGRGYFCAQALGFKEVSVCGDATFVHRRLGFKRFVCFAMLLLCTGAWVLSDFDASLR